MIFLLVNGWMPICKTGRSRMRQEQGTGRGQPERNRRPVLQKKENGAGLPGGQSLSCHGPRLFAGMRMKNISYGWQMKKIYFYCIGNRAEKQGADSPIFLSFLQEV